MSNILDEHEQGPLSGRGVRLYAPSIQCKSQNTSFSVFKEEATLLSVFYYSCCTFLCCCQPILLRHRAKKDKVPYWNSSSSDFAGQKKQQTIHHATTGFHPKLHRRKKHRNSILMMCHYPDLDSASDWSCCEGNLLNSTKHKHYLVMVSDMSSVWSGITAVIPHTSFCRETSNGFAKCQLFSRASDFARWCKHFLIINNKNLHWPMRQIEKTKVLVHRHSFSGNLLIRLIWNTGCVLIPRGFTRNSSSRRKVYFYRRIFWKRLHVWRKSSHRIPNVSGRI